MKQKPKNFIKQWIPPVFLHVLRGMFGSITWSGDYASWDEARASSIGYDSQTILEKVQGALLKVKNGEVSYERDSVLFDEIQYSWPLLAAFMWVTTLNKGELNVLDFGGSLGSTYFQNRKFFETLLTVQWSIVEQEAFIEAGRKYFEDDVIKFYDDMDSCVRDRSPNTILLSSVIQYIEKPYDLLRRVKSFGFQFILFDRTPFIHGNHDRLAVQKTHSSIYLASYPCWFLGKDRFRTFFQEDYETMAEFECSDTANIPSTFEGCILRRK